MKKYSTEIAHEAAAPCDIESCQYILMENKMHIDLTLFLIKFPSHRTRIRKRIKMQFVGTRNFIKKQYVWFVCFRAERVRIIDT